MFFQVTKRWDFIKMRDNVIPRGNSIREETIHISKSFAPYFMKCITIILTLQWSAV